VLSLGDRHEDAKLLQGHLDHPFEPPPGARPRSGLPETCLQAAALGLNDARRLVGRFI
jgi:hypothetical protein